MASIEKIVSPFIDQQFPAFYRSEGKNFVAFVRAYYEWLESSGKAINRSRSLLAYADIDETESEFLEYFKSTYMNSIPKDIASDSRLLLKHVLDLYRAKGSKRAVELLFRVLFGEDIDVYIPGDYLLRPSDGVWFKPHYIEVTSHPNLASLAGKTITNTSGASVAVVESYFKKIVSGRTVNVLYLSSVRGQFEYGEKILCDGLIDVNTAPFITGSLTAIPIENGGSGFSVGEILNVTGAGAEGKVRVASVRDENGKVRFTLLDGGSGYSMDSVITVATTLNLVISNPSDDFIVGSEVVDTTTNANGDVVFANSSYLTLVNFSNDLSFVPGDTVSDGTVTATIVDVIGGGGTGATFEIGDLINKELVEINTDIINDYASTAIETAVKVNITAPTAVFTGGATVRSSANAALLQVTYNTVEVALVGEKLSNTTLGVANLYVYSSDGKIVSVTGTEGDLTNANLVAGAVLAGNTSTCVVTLDRAISKETILGEGVVTSANNTATEVNITSGDHVYFVPTASIYDVATPTSNAIITSQERLLTDWGGFDSTPANLDRKINEVLDIYNMEVGTIAYLTNINPGSGYSSPPYVDIIEPDVVLQNILDEDGNVKGHNAVVTSRVSSEQGVVTAVEVYDSGFGFVPGDTVSLGRDGAGVVATGISVLSTDGKGTGYWRGSRGFISDIMKIQDSDYYQIYSYEVVASRMLNTYEKLVKDIVHPAGYKLFGRYRNSNFIVTDRSEVSESSVSQANATSVTVIDREFIANTVTFTRASNGIFTNIVNQFQTSGTNTPRYNYRDIATYSGLLIEGSRTNRIRNPRGAGGTIGAIGTGGVSPTNWNLTGADAAGLTAEILEFGNSDGISYVRIRLSGTAISQPWRWAFEASTSSAASTGQIWTNSIYHRLVAGSQSTLGMQIEIREFAGSTGIGQSSTSFTLSNSWQRASHTRTLGGPSTTNVQPSLRLSASATTYDVTFDIGFPQLELGTFASTPIIPPVGTIAASSRVNDLFTASLASLEISNQGTFLGTFMLPQAGPVGVNQFLMQIENDATNVYRIFNIAGAATIRGGRLTSNITSTETLADMTPGTPFRLGFTFNRTGRMAMSMEGATPVIVTGGPTGMVTLRLGNNPGNTAPMFGTCRFFQTINRALSDAELATSVGALPL